MSRRVEPARALRGLVRVPGDKSTSHRALMLAGLATGESRIEGISTGEDVRATARIVSQLGAQVSHEARHVTVRGSREGLRAASDDLDCGNSGTSMRLLTGVVSGVPGEHRLVGDASLSRRPMDRVAIPLRLMGAGVEGEGDSVTAPLRVTGRRVLHGIDYESPVASAQVKSAVLLAGLAGDAPSSFLEARRTRSTTEDMLRACGVNVASQDVGEGRRVTLVPSRPGSHRWHVPGDPSQAAFFAVLGVLHRDARIEVAPIDQAPERVGFLEVLGRMGAQISLMPDGSLLAESSPLHATRVSSAEIPSVDEVPILAVAAAAAEGVSVFADMGELRVKESDRFAGSLELVRALGCEAWSEGDDFFVTGLGDARAFSDFSISVHLDHRMVMAAAVAASAGVGGHIEGDEAIDSSYPGFFGDLASLQ